VDLSGTSTNRSLDDRLLLRCKLCVVGSASDIRDTDAESELHFLALIYISVRSH